MKKLFIFAAAIATLASCTKPSCNEIVSLADDNSIGFSAYTGTAATKGVSVAVSDVMDATKGFGVFAFYQPANNTTPVKYSSKRFGTPDFMYNQQVTPVIDPGTSAVTGWTYSPLKFWPSNTGDLVSFFAYAPYKADKEWEDLGFATDINATKLYASFPVYTEKTGNEDYIFATPALNRSKQHVSAIPGDPSPDRIQFEFKHIMSRVAINIGAIVNKVPAATPDAWTNTKTLITVQSIEFKGIAESYDYVCTIPGGVETWTAEGSQNLKLTKSDFRNNKSTDWTQSQWYPILAQEDVPGTALQRDGYLFIAPQDLTDNEVVITYRVVTTDPLHPANCSDITNVIKRKIGVNFESGKAYTLNFLIGLKTVEFWSEMTEWEVVTPAIQIDVPANESVRYVEGGVDYGYAIATDLGGTIGTVLWAPVNCGISTVNPLGKLYQWGRAVGTGYSGETGTVQTFQTGSVTDPDPALFYEGTGTTPDWYSETSLYPTSLCCVWPRTSATRGYLEGKIADPCPDGWRVPTVNELGALCYTDWVVDDYYDATLATLHPRGTWNHTTKSWDFGTLGLSLPAAGIVRPTTGSVQFEGRGEYETVSSANVYKGCYWSSWEECRGSEGNEFCMLFAHAGDADDTRSDIAMYHSNPRAYGFSVRCVYDGE